MRSLFALLLGAALPAAAFGDDVKGGAGPAPIPLVVLKSAGPVSYEKQIEPIIANKCQTCHSGSVKRGHLDLGSYEGMMRGGKRGKAVVAGKSADSLLVRLAGKTQKPFMPPKTEVPLAPEELALVKLWIDQGAHGPQAPRARARIVLGVLPAGVHPVRALAVSPDRSAVAAGRGNHIHIYNAATGAYVRSLIDPGLATADKRPVQAAHLAIVEALAFSPDSRYLASGGFQEVALWDAHTGLLLGRISGFADRVVAIAFSPDGKLLATGGGAPTEDGEIKVFRVADRTLVTEIKNGHSDTVFGVCFSPDSKKLATCAADKFVKVFEIPSGKFIKSFEGHTHHVLGVGWRADGKVLASAGADNVIKVWDYAKGEQIRTIAGHGKQITRLEFIGKTAEIVTCSGDETVRFWNVDNGGNVRNFGGGADFLFAVGVSPDGALVAAGGQEGTVRLYNGTNGQLIKELLPPDARLTAKKK